MNPELDQAYRETLYEVATDPPIDWVVDQINPTWAQWQAAQGVGASTFITAHNPFSQQQPDQINEKQQKALEEALTQAGWAWVRASGRHPSNGWPAEAGVVVWGMDYEAAKPWATRFGQYAVVCMNAQGLPKLHWIGV